MRGFFGLALRRYLSIIMLRIGIVGLRNADVYMKTLVQLPNFSFCGIYDPSLLVDRHQRSEYNIFQSFTDLCDSCQAVIFSIDDNLYVPLVAEAVRHSLDIYFDGVYNFNSDELRSLMRLRDEAGTTMLIGHPLLYSDVYQHLRENCKQPLDIQCNISRTNNDNLMLLAHNEISMLLTLLNSDVHRVAVNLYSSFSSLPDALRVRLDFDNGTIGNIVIDKYGIAPLHSIKVLNYNNMSMADMLASTITSISSENTDEPAMWAGNAADTLTPVRQLAAFYSSIMAGGSAGNSIENEIRTHIACEQIRAKMRINFNVF